PNKQEAKKIEAAERTKILEGRHGIRRQADITFNSFTETHLKDHAELHKRSVDRDRWSRRHGRRRLSGRLCTTGQYRARSPASQQRCSSRARGKFKIFAERTIGGPW